MALNKLTYVDNVTVIPASNLNAIQDSIIDLEENSGNSVPTAVRSAILTLFESAAYAETGLTDEIAVIESWAEQVTSLTISPTTLSLSNNTPQTITATVVPSGSTVSWSSSDTSVATVVAGVVTGVGNGTCTITATAGDISRTCAVTVSGFATLESISAVYTQSGTVYSTDSLDSLKADLVVTATYSDTSTETVPSTDYTLSGTLTVGTSTITVTYSGKQTTFNVTVSEQWDYEWDYTDGLPNNNGMTLTNNGGTISLESNGLSVATTDSSSSNVIYKYESISSSVVQETVSELIFTITAFSTQSGSGIRHYSGLGGTSTAVKEVAQLLFSQNGIQYLGSASGWSTLSSDAFSLNTEYTIRIEQTDGNADIYVNGNYVDSLSDYREQVAYPQFGVYRGASALIKSFKLKITA